MAESPAHKFGQTIGNVVEAAVEPLLEEFARKHALFLDRKGPRAARDGSKVTWTDSHGNKHDLDYVLERGGTSDRIGSPVAFIESAWRRYTKHSGNKAQEIQGAILPLIEAYSAARPFFGAILAGVFTQGALEQLRSLGFSVLYFPYDTVIEAFSRVGIEAQFDERTRDAESARRVRSWERLSARRRLLVSRSLLEINAGEVRRFVDALTRAVTRRVESVRVLPLHGSAVDLASVVEAIAFIESYRERNASGPVARYEVQLRYDNGDRIDGQFQSKTGAIEFLHTFEVSTR
jgi:hypothetical protein